MQSIRQLFSYPIASLSRHTFPLVSRRVCILISYGLGFALMLFAHGVRSDDFRPTPWSSSRETPLSNFQRPLRVSLQPFQLMGSNPNLSAMEEIFRLMLEENFRNTEKLILTTDVSGFEQPVRTIVRTEWRCTNGLINLKERFTEHDYVIGGRFYRIGGTIQVAPVILDVNRGTCYAVEPESARVERLSDLAHSTRQAILFTLRESTSTQKYVSRLSGSAVCYTQLLSSQDEEIYHLVASDIVVGVLRLLEQKYSIVVPSTVGGGRTQQCYDLDSANEIPKEDVVVKLSLQLNDAQKLVLTPSLLVKENEKEYRLPKVVMKTRSFGRFVRNGLSSVETMLDGVFLSGQTLIRVEHLEPAFSTRASKDQLRIAKDKLDQGDLSGAAASLIWLLSRTPNEVRALNKMGQIRQRQGRTNEARNLFKKALAVEPGNLVALSNMTELDLAAGRREQAQINLQMILRAAEEQADDAKLVYAHVGLADMANAEAQLARARRHLQSAYAIAPRNPQVLTGLTYMGAQTDNWDTAFRYLREAKLVVPSSRFKPLETYLYTLKGQKEYRKKWFNDAVKSFTRVLEISPTARTYLLRARSYIYRSNPETDRNDWMRDWNMAIRDYRSAIASLSGERDRFETFEIAHLGIAELLIMKRKYKEADLHIETLNHASKVRDHYRAIGQVLSVIKAMLTNESPYRRKLKDLLTLLRNLRNDEGTSLHLLWDFHLFTAFPNDSKSFSWTKRNDFKNLLNKLGANGKRS